MLQFNSYSNYTIADNRFYEEFGRADLPYEFEHDVRAMASTADEVVANGYWVICRPAGLAPLSDHGWKIHISSVPSQTKEALRLLATEFRRQPFHFKCLRDQRMVLAATSRAWPTGQVGKIITIYPADAAQTRSLLARLHPVFADIVGPYILTDRRYRDSRCL